METHHRYNCRNLHLGLLDRLFFHMFLWKKISFVPQIQSPSLIPSSGTETHGRFPYLAVPISCGSHRFSPSNPYHTLLCPSPNLSRCPQLTWGSLLTGKYINWRSTPLFLFFQIQPNPAHLQLNSRKFIVVYLSSLTPLPRDHKELLKLAFLSSSHYLSIQEQQVCIGNIASDHAWKTGSQTISYQVAAP